MVSKAQLVALLKRYLDNHRKNPRPLRVGAECGCDLCVDTRTALKDLGRRWKGTA